MTDAKSINPEAFAALQANFKAQSRKAQAYYAAMHAVGQVLKSEDGASAWMEQPLQALDGQTPAQAIAAGREKEVIACIANVRA